MLDRPHTDVQQLARDALARGADLLGVAGGDGTQALVAQVAAEHDVPFLVVSAGTRNHFALDLGLDREDPALCLDALRDGVELRIDLGRDRRTAVRQQRLVRRVRRDRGQPGLPRQQARHHPASDARAAERPARCAPRRRDADGLVDRRAAGAAGQQQPVRDLRPGRAGGGPGWTAGRWASSPSRWTRRGRRSACCTAPSQRGLLRTQGREVVVDSDELTDPGGHRRGVGAPVRPRALHGASGRAPGAASP